MPDNRGYAEAAYLIASFIYLAYSVTLYFRARRAVRARD